MCDDEKSPKPENPYAIEAVKSLVQVWTSDNSITVSKVAQYVTLQVVLAGFDKLSVNSPPNSPPGTNGLILPIVAVSLSVVWFFSLGRTFAYRDLWKEQIAAIVEENPSLHYFNFLDKPFRPPIYGLFPSNLVQMGTIVFGGFVWLLVIFHRAICRSF
jgi:hypothetical protein